MQKIMLTIAAISLLMAVSEVFAIQWLKKLLEGIIELSNVQLYLINFVLSIFFGLLAYLSFNYILVVDGLSKWVCLVFMFLILGFSQMVYTNYNKIEKMMQLRIEQTIMSMALDKSIKNTSVRDTSVRDRVKDPRVRDTVSVTHRGISK